MRVISGIYKGRHIHVSRNFKARPTTDYAKESLFNILNNHFDFTLMRALDLFAGSGSISLELASRGCQAIDSLDFDPEAIRSIRKTCHEWGITTIEAHRGNAFRFIEKCKKKFTLVFADPPYTLEGIDRLPKLVFSHSLVEEGGWLVLEHSSAYSFAGCECFYETRKYGNVHFSIFVNEVSHEQNLQEGLF